LLKFKQGDFYSKITGHSLQRQLDDVPVFVLVGHHVRLGVDGETNLELLLLVLLTFSFTVDRRPSLVD
jgi:hypothetical protein